MRFWKAYSLDKLLLKRIFHLFYNWLKKKMSEENEEIEKEFVVPEYIKLEEEQLKIAKELYKKYSKEKIVDNKLICRFLRARQFDQEKTDLMIKEHISWNKETKPDEITFKSKSIQNIRKLRYSYMYGKSKKGMPLCWMEPGGSNPNPVFFKLIKG
jgi:hypothetical protein